jgi:hypothetical protein
MVRASKPAILARPISIASVTSPGRSSPKPDSADAPKPSYAVKISSAARSIPSRRAGRSPAGQI